MYCSEGGTTDVMVVSGVCPSTAQVTRQLRRERIIDFIIEKIRLPINVDDVEDLPSALLIRLIGDIIVRELVSDQDVLAEGRSILADYQRASRSIDAEIRKWVPAGDRNLVLTKPGPADAIGMDRVGLLSRLIVSRDASLTCPVQFGVVIGSLLEARSVPGADFAASPLAVAFRGVTSLAQVLTMPLSVRKVFRTAGGPAGSVVVEFEPPEAGSVDAVFPIAWFGFDRRALDEAQGVVRLVDLLEGERASGSGSDQAAEDVLGADNIAVHLDSLHAARTVGIMLIAPDNRMEELGDNHPDANIDMVYFGFDGWEVEATTT